MDESGRGALFVFFSFDLVNSTRYKNLSSSGFPFVIGHFFEAVLDGMHKRIDGCHVWKFMGDEVLMFKQITRADQLRQCVEASFAVIASSASAIHSEFPDTSELFVQGATWCGRVGRGKNMNFLFRSIGPDNAAVDFLGADIEAGFRVAGHSGARRLVVSAELAYLLHLGRADFPRIEERLKIVSYQVLKGVWEGRPYPIVWYEGDWGENPENLLPLADLARIAREHDCLLSMAELWEEYTTTE